MTPTACLLLVAAAIPLALCVAHGGRAPGAPRAWLCLGAAVLAGHVWILTAGEAALQWRPWLLRSIAYPLIELVLLAEMVHRRAGGQARTLVLGRGLVVALALAMSLAALVPTGGASGSAVQAGVILLRLDIALATAYLGLLALLAWHRTAIRSLEVAIMVGIVVLRALHALALWLWIAPGRHVNGDLIQLAEVAVFLWWTAASWPVRDRPRVAMAGA